MRTRADREARAALIGFFLLKAKEETPGAKIEVRSSGPGSGKPELDRFFGIAPGSSLPYMNPFGMREERPEWLSSGYERSGLYTWLYPGRVLERFLPVTQSDGRRLVSIPNTAARHIANELLGGKRIPLEPAAAFLLRKETFSANPDRQELVRRFQAVFHLSERERDDLFEPDPDFTVDFDNVGFGEGLVALPPDLRPPSPKAGQAAVAAATRVVPVTADIKTDIILPDDVLRRARRALACSGAIALVGPPGTGKSILVDRLLEEARADPTRFGFSRPPVFDRYTPAVDWTDRNVIGAHFPQEGGRLVFQDGYLLQAIRNGHWLVLDEMNRADLDRILGPFLTFLAGQHVDLGRTELSEIGKPMLLAISDDVESSRVYEDEKKRIYLSSPDLRLIGTYNNVDLGRTFGMGGALTRRWATVPVPPLSADRLPEVLRQVPALPADAADLIQRLYALHVTPDAETGLLPLPLGPGPFVELARYVAGAGADAPPPEMADDWRPLLGDAYVLYVGPQLRRVSGPARRNLLAGVRSILGEELANELARTF